MKQAKDTFSGDLSLRLEYDRMFKEQTKKKKQGCKKTESCTKCKYSC